MLSLSPRLKAVYDLVPHGTSVADIGTDHALIPICLYKNKISSTIIATDVKPGPVAAAKNNIKKFGANEISIRLGNGLTPIKLGEAQTIIIAGMGGELIRFILEECPAVAHLANTLILQPMTAISELREFLYLNDYQILYERLVKEGNKLYTVIKASTGFDKVSDTIYYTIGKKLIENKDPLLPLLIKKEIYHLSNKIKGMETAKNADNKILENLKIEFTRLLNMDCLTEEQNETL